MNPVPPVGRLSVRDGFRALWSKRFARHALVLAYGILLVHLFAIFWILRPTDAPVIVHYNAYLGADILGPWWAQSIGVVVGSVIALINTILALFFAARRDDIAVLVIVCALIFLQGGAFFGTLSLMVVRWL